MPERKLEYLLLADLVPAERNPKRHNAGGVSKSIARFGYIEPVVLDERTGRLVAGHGRMEALMTARDAGETPPDGIRLDKNGAWLLPVLRGWESNSDAEAEAYLLASNRLVELGGWDQAELDASLAALAAIDAQWVEVAGWDPTEYLPSDPPDPGPHVSDWATRFEVVIECANEAEQKALFETMASQGRKCRVLTL
jgi:hypothetical protein